ncbi:MAG: hypothetical protein NTW86_02100 [Candidatus Sumerlaeota bacterium]|nr:hypothetical protein [Candidatus Sumerlaeota bacterium]
MFVNVLSKIPLHFLLASSALAVDGNPPLISAKPLRDWIPAAYAYAVVKPVDLSDARITGGYLGAYVDRTRDISVLDLFAKMKERGVFDNFKFVTEGLPDKHVGGFNEDEWVHKLVEAAGYFAPHSREIDDAFQPLIHNILASQAKDGYLQSYYQNPA